MKEYFVGLDLGQSQDFSAMAVLQRIETETKTERAERIAQRKSEPAPLPQYYCRTLHRWPLGTSYPAIIEAVKMALKTPELLDRADLVIDATGVGRPVVDSFAQAGVNHTGVVITGGHNVTRSGSLYSVPKRHLVSTLQVLLQGKRIDFAPNPTRETLIKEMLDFKVTITEAANDTYGGRAGTHDDLVLAVALAAWRGESPAPVVPAPREAYGF
jgi:hypothetical protein